MFLAMLKKTLSLKKVPCNGGKRRVTVTVTEKRKVRPQHHQVLLN